VKCIVFANGHIGDYERHRTYIKNGDFILCADGGARHALEMGLVPDYVLGDFDSLAGRIKARLDDMLKPEQFIGFPREKDKTDTHLAVEMALEKNPEQIVLMGATGSRLDHTLANICLLTMFENTVPIVLVNDNNELTLITESINLEGEPGEEISLLPLTPVVRGLTTTGLKWPLYDHTLVMGDSLGISNVMLGRTAGVTIKEGRLLVIRSRD